MLDEEGECYSIGLWKRDGDRFVRKEKKSRICEE
jgi:hypothetical protein